jgi:hypothetical protein
MRAAAVGYPAVSASDGCCYSLPPYSLTSCSAPS